MKIKLTLLGLLSLIVIVFLIKPYYLFLTKTLKISVLKTLFSKNSLKTFDDQVNILILGIPGDSYQGPNLSDSIIVANYNFSSNQLTTISIPRDIWSDTLRDKINTAYAYGEATMAGGGLKLARAELSTIIGQPIHYGAIIDFSKFETLIDFLGGVTVEIDRSFTDKKFPLPGKEDDTCGGDDEEFKCRYETISFNKGLTTMNGKTALKFVRSRNAKGTEGSDFAREARQQKVVDALEKKLIHLLKTIDLRKIDGLYKQLDQLVSRDINNQQVAIIAKSIVLKGIFRKKLIKKQLALSQDFFFVPPYYQYDGKYVLMPTNKDFTIIHTFINCQLANKNDCEDGLKKE